MTAMGKSSAKSLIGKVFKLLTVVAKAGTKNNQLLWKVECECGNSSIVSGSSLRSGSTTSCGCIRREKARNLKLSHGKRWDPIYAVWRSMKRRCTSPKDKKYKDYGGRGITFTPRWKYFENFQLDMAESYSYGLELDRIDNSGNYHKDNCRWITHKENLNNKRNNRFVEWNGELKTVSQLAEMLNMSYSRLYIRLKRYSWKPEEALKNWKLFR